jgi:predicted lactoylglutathione lyase
VKAACAEERAAAEQPETEPAYVAIEAPDDFTVRAFYRAAMEAGGRQLGYPGPQPTEGRYSYYAAKVADPDGNCIECGWRH